MTRSPNCQAYQAGGQIICPACGLNWDVDDKEPPECRQPPPTPKPKGRTVPTDKHPIGGSL